MKAREKVVRIRSRNETLPATVLVPPVISGACVLLHGLCVDRNEYDGFYVDLAAALAANGIISVRFDFAGHGRRAQDWRKLSIVGQVIETISAVEWLLAEHNVQPRRVALVGTSFGAPPAIFAATERSDVIDRIALCSPVLDYEATFLDPICGWGQQNFGAAPIARAHQSGVLTVDGTQRLPDRIFDEMALLEPLHRLSEAPCHTLVLHGAADSMVPVGPARTAGTYSNVTYREFLEMEHGPFHAEDETGREPRSAALRKQIIDLIVGHVVQGVR